MHKKIPVFPISISWCGVKEWLHVSSVSLLMTSSTTLANKRFLSWHGTRPWHGSLVVIRGNYRGNRLQSGVQTKILSKFGPILAFLPDYNLVFGEWQQDGPCQQRAPSQLKSPWLTRAIEEVMSKGTDEIWFKFSLKFDNSLQNLIGTIPEIESVNIVQMTIPSLLRFNF